MELEKGENIGAGIHPYTLAIQLVFPEPVASFILQKCLACFYITFPTRNHPY